MGYNEVMRKGSNIIGHRFGRLVVLHMDGRNNRGRFVWKCRCDCGTEKAIAGDSLRRGQSRSCGCLRAEMTGRRFSRLGTYEPLRKQFPDEARSYDQMIQRCENPKREKFKDYGGRGIAVCQRWKSGGRHQTGFASFLSDMGRRQSAQRSLDRVDNNLGYSPQNCRWATPEQQSQNRRPYKRGSIKKIKSAPRPPQMLPLLPVMTDETLRSRFWSKVQKGTAADCWQWIAAKNASGYGFISIDGRVYRAHRISYLLAYGCPPDSHEITHSCDNPSCVNPEHLVPGLHKENMRDMAAKGRAKSGHLAQP